MWQNSRDRSVITGFSSSAAALVFTSAAVIWLYAYPKCEYPGEMISLLSTLILNVNMLNNHYLANAAS